VASGKTVASGEAIASCCTLIVTAANEFARHIHDRMPVLLGHHDFELG
jgi:putative SOS response-associated peptidase YedK